MANTYSKLLIHLVFVVRYRKPLITTDIADSLYAHMGQLLINKDMIPLMIGGYRDHVHIFFIYIPHKNLSEIVKDIKTSTTFWINRNKLTREKFYWQGGYAAFSVSPSKKESLINYIRNQENHHGNNGKVIEEEYRRLLEFHGIAYDEKYLFDEPVIKSKEG